MKYIKEYYDFLNELTFSGGDTFNVHKELVKRFFGNTNKLIRVSAPDNYDSSKIMSPSEAKEAVRAAKITAPNIKKINGYSPLPIGQTIDNGLLDKLYFIDMNDMQIYSQWQDKTKAKNITGSDTVTTNKLKPAISFIYGWMAPRSEYFFRNGYYVVVLKMKNTFDYTYNYYLNNNDLDEKHMYQIAYLMKFAIDKYTNKEIKFIDPYDETDGLLSDEIRSSH